MGRSVTVQKRAESGQEAVQMPQAMHLAASYTGSWVLM